MQRFSVIVTLSLVVAALSLGSSGFMVQAQETGAGAGLAQTSFGESVPSIPGHSVPYLASGWAPSTAVSFESGSDTGFAKAPLIPGYNVSYPAFGRATSARAVAGSWSAAAPLIPGHSNGGSEAGIVSIAAGASAEAPSIPGYNGPYPALGSAAIGR